MYKSVSCGNSGPLVNPGVILTFASPGHAKPSSPELLSICQMGPSIENFSLFISKASLTENFNKAILFS